MKHLKDKNLIGDGLITKAWIFEVCFCIFGLFSAFTITWASIEAETFSELSFKEIMPLTLGLLVWIAVAFTELLKIPVTQGIMHSRKFFTKIPASVFLFLICFLTFESILSGLTISFETRLEPVNELRMDKKNLEDKIALLGKQESEISIIDEKEIRDEQYAAVEVQAVNIDDENRRYENIINSLRNPKASAEIKELKSQLTYLKKENIRIGDDITRTTKEFDDFLKASSESEIKAIKNNNLFNKRKVIEDFQKRRDLRREQNNKQLLALNNELSENKKSIESITAQLTQLTATPKEVLGLIQEYQNKIESGNETKEKLYASVDNRILERIKTNDENISLKQTLNDEIRSVENEINDIAAQMNAKQSDVVFMLAKMFFSKEVSDLEKQEVNFVVMMLSMSMAGLVAIAGVMLTFIATSNQLDKGPKKQIIRRRFAKFFADLRRRVRKPKIIKEKVEVEKIVEVEKPVEVEKIVEVEKEIEVEKIVKEVIEVPTPVKVPTFISVPVPKEPDELPAIDEIIDEHMAKDPEDKGGVH